MSDNPVRILISNDDGYSSPGIHALHDALIAQMGNRIHIDVIAPSQDRSGASNSLTLDRPLTVTSTANGFRYVNGTPTDCVHLAVTGLLEQRPHLVVSGINNGANMGDDTIYSGTVAAAMEGYQCGLPAIAFSLTDYALTNLDSAARVAAEFTERVINRLESFGHCLLNVNIPPLPYDELQGYEVTRLGKRHHAEPVILAQTPKGKPVYWIGPPGSAKDAGPGTDFHAVKIGKVSVTALKADLTHTEQNRSLTDWV